MVRATAATRSPRSLRYALAILLIAAGAAVVFGATLHFEFVQWGDAEHVAKNPAVLAGSIARFWREATEHVYAPVTYTIWAVLARAAQVPAPGGGVALSPHLFHAANLAVHGLNAVLVFHLILVLLGLRALPGGVGAAAAETPAELARRRDRRVTLAAVGALVFAVHPVQAEAVSWVTGFMDVLATCFGLGALFHLLVSVAREHAPLDRDAFASATAVPRALLFERPAAHYAAGLVLLVLALLSKPSAVAVPLVAAALLGLLLPMSPRAFARAIAPWLLLALPVAWVAFRAQGPTAGFETPLLDRPLVAGDAISFYLGKVMAPIRLSPLYNRAPGTLLSHEHIERGALLPLVLGACLAYLWWRRRSPWVFLYAAFVAALLPVLGLVPFAYQEQSTVADHYAYLGMAVVGVTVAFGLAAVMNRRSDRGARVVMAVAVVALVGLGALAHAQATIWRTSIDVFRHALVGNPRSVEVRIRLGESYALAGRTAEAEVEFERALAISPNDARIHSRIGNMEARQGRLADAVASFQRSIELEPRVAEVRNNLGTTYAQMGDLASAAREFTEAVRLDPSMAEAHNNLGQALAMQGRMDEAIEHFRRAVALKPSLADARANLEQALRQPH